MVKAVKADGNGKITVVFVWGDGDLYNFVGVVEHVFVEILVVNFEINHPQVVDCF